jgi:AraC-like DNA-binding protein
LLPTPLELRPDLLSLADELQRPGGADSELFAQTLLLRLLLGLSRAYEPERQRRPSLHGVISRIEAFLQTNLHRPLTREDVARAVHLSAPHLARVYRDTTGKTIGRRLTELRVERAKQLLLGSTLPITQVAGEVGLSSFSHFIKVFRHEVGLVPSAFRERGGGA